MSGGRIFVVVLSVFILLIGFGLLAGGGALLWTNTFLKDADGFYTTRAIDIRRDSYGVTTYPARIEFGPTWVFDWSNLVQIKISASNNTDKSTFIGIAEDTELTNYLSDVAYDEIRDLDIYRPFREPNVTYREFSGSSAPEPPTNRDFWAASTSGTGTQVLEWGIEEGSYSLALMNQDGSRGLDLSGSIGVKIPMIAGIGIGLTAGGAIMVFFAFFLVYITVSRSRVKKEMSG